MDPESFDVAVIGGGPGGYVAAIRASQLGLNVALIEREHLGGICLNWGCIPSKALLRSAEINNLLSRLDEFGFSADNIKFDSDQIIKRSRKIADQLARGVEYLLKKNKVRVISGFGKIAAPNRVDVAGTDETTTINALHIVLATGARPRVLPFAPQNDPNIWTYKEAMVPSKVPESLTIIGSGAIGVEFASFYRDMGSSVTLIEALSSILPAEDIEISEKSVIPVPVISRELPPPKPVSRKPRRRQSSFQPAKRAKRLDRSRHMEYKYEVRRVLEEIGVPEEHRSSILGSIWAKGERQTVSDAKEYLEDKLSEGIISEGHVSKLCEVIDDYTVRR